jgi:hypothetical protein
MGATTEKDQLTKSGLLSEVETPFFGLTTIVRDPKELRVAHEKVDALHAATFLILVDANAALPSVALLVCMGGASLVSGRLERVELRRCDVGA